MILSFAAFPPVAASAQPQSTPRSEAAALADGWTRLSKGDVNGAAQAAAAAIKRYPRSVAALSLGVEAETARGGWSAALRVYEQWLGDRKVEAPYALRIVARGVLKEGAKLADRAARLDALQMLAADGDSEAAATLEQASASGSPADARALAIAGDERAVQTLIDQVKTGVPAARGLAARALGESGSMAAAPVLTTLLRDRDDQQRSIAAEALGRIGAVDAVPQLQALLNDPVFLVKLKAAGALYRMNDPAGLTVLRQALGSEHAAIRLAAAQEMAVHPDAEWESVVRALTGESDPMVRVEAAKLIAPHDAALAKTVLDEAARSNNPGIQDLALTAVAENLSANVTTLRGLLRNGDARVRVKAAGRVLRLTR